MHFIKKSSFQFDQAISRATYLGGKLLTQMPEVTILEVDKLLEYIKTLAEIRNPIIRVGIAKG